MQIKHYSVMLSLFSLCELARLNSKSISLIIVNIICTVTKMGLKDVCPKKEKTSTLLSRLLTYHRKEFKNEVRVLAKRKCFARKWKAKTKESESEDVFSEQYTVWLRVRSSFGVSGGHRKVNGNGLSLVIVRPFVGAWPFSVLRSMLSPLSDQ